MGLCWKQDRAYRKPYVLFPPDHSSRAWCFRTGVFFTMSQYFLDVAPQQLLLHYQSHVSSWDEFFWFLDRDYLHLDGNDGCWQGRWADERRGEKPCQPLCAQLLSQFKSTRNPCPHKHRCRWPCKSNRDLAAAQIPHSSWLHWSLFPTWPHLSYPCSGQPGKQCAVFLKTCRSFCGSGKEMGVRYRREEEHIGMPGSGPLTLRPPRQLLKSGI